MTSTTAELIDIKQDEHKSKVGFHYNYKIGLSLPPVTGMYTYTGRTSPLSSSPHCDRGSRWSPVEPSGAAKRPKIAHYLCLYEKPVTIILTGAPRSLSSSHHRKPRI